MSNTEEPTESNQKRSSYVNQSPDVEEFLESGRKKAKTCLSTDEDVEKLGLGYMLKSAKALVKIINEIWNNCEDHLILGENDNSTFTFQRRIFKEAEVKKKGRKLKITTQKVSNTKNFGNLPSVPENLGEMISIGQAQAESDILPDYNKYIDKSAILCEDVLLPFLTGLKEHLKNVQVFLGQIEAWLIEPELNVSFLNQTFDKDLVANDTLAETRYLNSSDNDDLPETELYGSYCLDVNCRYECNFDICTEVGRKGLETALAFLKTHQTVTQIVVKDAGEKSVNGTYTINGEYNNVYGYTRSGLWNGKHVMFTLFSRRHNSDNSRSWFISCKPSTSRHGSERVFLYRTEATGQDEYKLPPMNGWGNASRGIDPPPTLQMISMQQQGTSFALPPITIPILVKKSTGETITLDVQNTDTVSFLKSKIQEHLNVPREEQCLFSYGKEFCDEKDTLRRYAIRKGLTLNLIPSSLSTTPFIKVYIKFSTGETSTYVVYSTETIRRLTDFICYWERLPSGGNQGLIYSGSQLEENRTLSSYNIQNESHLHFVLYPPQVQEEQDET